MSASFCDYCDNLIDHDWTEGEWDVTDRDGTVHDFVCQDCLINSDDFLYDEKTDTYIEG